LLLIRSLVFTTFLFITALLGGFLALVTFWAPDRWLWWLTLSWCRLSVWAGDFSATCTSSSKARKTSPTNPA
jgi:hypothetical protein